MFIPYLDPFINQLESRFIDHKTIWNGFQFPFGTNAIHDGDFIQLIETYIEELVTPTSNGFNWRVFSYGKEN